VREIFVVGSQATLVVDCTNQRINKRCGGISYEIPVIASNTIASEIDHFVDKILHGDLAADYTGSRTVETLEAVRSSLWRRVPRVARSESEKSPSHHEMPNLETAAGLLEIVHKGTNNTPVTSPDDLDPDLTQRYFMMLEKIGLVEGRSRANSEEKVYCITTKGLQFLTDFYESERLGEITDNTRRVLEAVGLGTG